MKEGMKRFSQRISSSKCSLFYYTQIITTYIQVIFKKLNKGITKSINYLIGIAKFNIFTSII